MAVNPTRQPVPLDETALFDYLCLGTACPHAAAIESRGGVMAWQGPRYKGV